MNVRGVKLWKSLNNQNLNLERSRLTELPNGIGMLNNLKMLSLNHNNLINLP